MDISYEYPVPADDRDKKTKRLIVKWYVAKFWLGIVQDTFRLKRIKSSYLSHTVRHIIAIIIVSICRNVTLKCGNVPAITCMTWIVALVVISACWPLIRLVYWLCLYVMYDDKRREAIGDKRILLIGKQRY